MMFNRKNQRSRSAGFTLIQFIVVIIVVGILAAAVVPRFIDASSSSQQATLNATAQALTSAAAANFTLSKAGSSKAVSITNCQNVQNALPTSYPMPQGYTITSSALSSGQQASCTVNAPGGLTASFTGIGS